jgi:hypothetical protein
MKRVEKNRSAGAIGIIGGADGPTTVFVGKPYVDGQWRKTLENCKQAAALREAHVIEEYGAYEVPVSRGQRLALKVTVLMNYYSEALAQPPTPPQDADLEAWKAWAEQSQLDMETAESISDEQYGLRYLFLAVPRNAKTERYYMEAQRELRQPQKSFWQRLFGKKAPPVRAKKMIFGIELSTGYCQLDGGSKTLMDEVTVWRGVTREDIEHETPAFTAYAAAMRDTGC